MNVCTHFCLYIVGACEITYFPNHLKFTYESKIHKIISLRYIKLQMLLHKNRELVFT